VDDLLHLAERLRVRLADLLGHQRRQALLVGLDQPADRGDHPAADRGGHLRPLPLRVPGGAARAGERVGVRQPHRRHGLAEPRGVDRGVRVRTGGFLAADDGNNLTGHRCPPRRVFGQTIISRAIPQAATVMSMIMRTWRGWTRAADAADYEKYLMRPGFAEYTATPGNRGAYFTRRDAGEDR